MTGQELDLTAAIDAVADVTNGNDHEYNVDAHDWLPRCICGWSATEQYDVAAYDRHFATVAVNAALSHIREALADQVNAQERAIEAAQLEAMGGLLTPLSGGIVAGYAQAARIVRGEP